MGATNSTQSEVILKTPKGHLRGIQFSDAASGKPVYHRYARIPYALPPTGQRRWQKPHPLSDDFSFNASSGEAGDYTAFGPICPQPVHNHNSARLENPDAAPEPPNAQSEDCLYLNVWVPVGRDCEMPKGGWPVQFYIHGGWLQVGDAMQNSCNDPFDLLLVDTHPRIIVSPTYRLNLFGFLCTPPDPFPDPTSDSNPHSDHCPGNLGLWDQRLALEFTHRHIHLFSGNPSNLTLGGLSAGAHSALFQLHYDTYSTPLHSRPMIRRVYLWSNTVGIQPNQPTAPALSGQFAELTNHFSIPSHLPISQQLAQLRHLSTSTLISAIPHLKYHTFRAVTDDAFIPTNFLTSIYHPQTSTFAHRLKQNDVKILLGELAHESRLYALVNPPSSRADLELQLQNYYPDPVVAMQMRTYPLPGADDRAELWTEVYARILAETQIHAPLRGFVAALLHAHPPPHLTTAESPPILAITDILRYRICWRARSLDSWLRPEMGVCHGADAPIWWRGGVRAGFDSEDKRKVAEFCRLFGEFVYGDEGGEGWWGTRKRCEMRELGQDGETRIVRDKWWEEGLRAWERLWRTQQQQQG